MRNNHQAIIGMILLVMVTGCLQVHAQLPGKIILTSFGKVEGAHSADGTVMAFKGIPYAAPPVGELRWKEPQSPATWKGVRDATQFCASCMQNRAFSREPWTSEFMVQDSISEDCLFLNIWTPAKTATDKLPVLVYIHGGALSEGSGSVAVYDGEELAKKGIIVITINYRLGVFGFLAHPELTAESTHKASGNFGFLDQVAALKWVQQNIAAFGGDPSRVTIAGQSAGAASVRVLTISPLAKGLFHRAITQSGTTFSSGPMNTRSLADAEKQGVEYAGLRGAPNLAALRALPAAELLKTDSKTAAIRFGGVLDGYFQTAEAIKVFADGKQHDTPFMSGMNADETRYNGSRDEEFKALYPSSTKADSTAAEKVAGQEQARLNTWLWLEYRSKTAKTPGYEYFFNRAIPWPERPQFGAFHTAEVPYVFNNMKMVKNHTMEKADTLVADRMSSYWANFVKTGDPNGPGLPRWEPYTPGKREVMQLGEHMGMIPIAASEGRFSFLEKQLKTAR